ncbi:MAG: hypothetical protein ABFD92_07555 [Planctomycetaceae bacterium]
MKTLLIVGEFIVAMLIWLVTLLVLPFALLRGLPHLKKYLRVTRM